MKRSSTMVIFFLFLGFLIQLHQFLVWGVWFQTEDIHHETFALMCLAAAFGIVIGNVKTRRDSRLFPSS